MTPSPETIDVALQHELVLAIAVALSGDGASDEMIYALLNWTAIRYQAIELEALFSVESRASSVIAPV